MLLKAAIFSIEVAETEIANPLNLSEDAGIGIRQVPAAGGVADRCMEFVVGVIQRLAVEGLCALLEREEMKLSF